MRVGYSWPSGHGTRTWVSMGFWGWLAAWLVLVPLVAVWITVWLVVQLLVAAVKGVAWVIDRVHQAPAVPGPLRTPPRRRQPPSP
jgi:hypothetical protein